MHACVIFSSVRLAKIKVLCVLGTGLAVHSGFRERSRWEVLQEGDNSPLRARSVWAAAIVFGDALLLRIAVARNLVPSKAKPGCGGMIAEAPFLVDAQRTRSWTCEECA